MAVLYAVLATLAILTSLVGVWFLAVPAVLAATCIVFRNELLALLGSLAALRAPRVAPPTPVRPKG